MTHLLDTNALSEAIRPTPDPGFLRWRGRHLVGLAIASVTWHEAMFGLHRLPRGKARERIERYLLESVKATLPILPYDETAAQWHAEERARLAKTGLTPPFADGQIAAIAVTRNLSLLTANLKDFKHFKHLKVESWLTA